MALKENLPKTSQFLNRLLSMRLDEQRKVFKAFDDRLMAKIRQAEIAGTLDRGVETIRADRIEKLAEHLVYTDPASGAETKIVEFKVGQKTKIRTFDAVMSGGEATSYARPEFFARNIKSGKVYCFIMGSDRTDRHGTVQPMYIELGPAWSHRKYIPQRELRESDYNHNTYQSTPRWHRYETGSDAMAEVKRLWNQQVAELPTWEESSLTLCCGTILTIYDRLPQTNTKVRRLQTVDGQRYLGRVIEDEELEDTLRRLGVEHRKSAESPETMAAKLLAGTHAYELVNGWKLVGKRVNGDRRIEIVGAQFNHLEYLRNLAGCWFERMAFVGHIYLPAGNVAAESIRKLVAEKPVAQSLRLDKAA